MREGNFRWDDPARIAVRLPGQDLRHLDGSLAICIAFARDLDRCFPDHVSIILSDVHGVITMDEARELAAHPDFPVVRWIGDRVPETGDLSV